jgi:hypothetical protein
LAHRRHQLPCALAGQTIIRCAEAAAGAFSLTLEADAPIGALEASSILFDADGPEQVELPFGEVGLAVVYAIIGFHVMPRYATGYLASTST